MRALPLAPLAVAVVAAGGVALLSGTGRATYLPAMINAAGAARFGANSDVTLRLAASLDRSFAAQVITALWKYVIIITVITATRYYRVTHESRLHAAQLRRADLLAVRQATTHACERRFDTRRDVARAANHLVPAAAVIDDADGQAVGIRVSIDVEHFGHDDSRIRPRECLARIDLEPQ